MGVLGGNVQSKKKEQHAAKRYGEFILAALHARTPTDRQGIILPTSAQLKSPRGFTDRNEHRVAWEHVCQVKSWR